MAKDLFYGHAKLYAQFRPHYPQELFDYILSFVEEKKCAWDCATGNGQAAIALANHFNKVVASDLSKAQINSAVIKTNVEYHVCSAEETPFASSSFDLITVAQAYHWFDWQKFHDEATRVGKNRSVIAVWGYNIFSSEDENVNQLIHHFYYDIVYDYWDAERRHVENNYSSVNFDFDRLLSKTFTTDLTYTKEHFIGYLQSWSAVQNYIRSNQSSPLDLIKNDIEAIWQEQETKPIHFPIFLKLGRIIK